MRTAAIARARVPHLTLSRPACRTRAPTALL